VLLSGANKCLFMAALPRPPSQPGIILSFAVLPAVLLRGANDYLLDEMDRCLHDAFCIVKRVLESGEVVPGGLVDGCVEGGCSEGARMPVRAMLCFVQGCWK